MMVVFWLVLAALLIMALVSFGDQGRKGSDRRDREDSLQILNQRLVRGDISLEEYQRIRETLHS